MSKPAKPPKALKSHQCAAKVLQPGDRTTPPNLLAEVSAHLPKFHHATICNPPKLNHLNESTRYLWNWIKHKFDSCQLPLETPTYYILLPPRLVGYDPTWLVGNTTLAAYSKSWNQLHESRRTHHFHGVLCHWCGWRILDVRVPTPDKKRGLFFSHLAYVEWWIPYSP